MNFAAAFSENACIRPDHPAVEDGERIVTYAELEALANTAAANLLKEGIEPGDIVGLGLPDSVEHVALFWSLARIGAVVFPINVQLLRGEQVAGLGEHQLKVVIVEGAASALPSEARAILLKTVFAKRLDAAMPVVLDGPGDDHPLACVQSSGTTGIPKTFPVESQ